MTPARLWGTAAAVGATAALLLPVWPVLSVHAESGDRGFLRLGDDAEFTVSFTHSIDGLPIEDEYQIRDGEVVLESTRIRSFGAGMGHIPGRGSGGADGTDWVVEEIDEPVGELHVRAGNAQVDHRLLYSQGEVALSRCWESERVTLSAARVSTLRWITAGPEPAGCDTETTNEAKP